MLSKRIFSVLALAPVLMAAECPTLSEPVEESETATDVPFVFVNRGPSEVNVRWPQGNFFVEAGTQQLRTIHDTSSVPMWTFEIDPLFTRGPQGQVARPVSVTCNYSGGGSPSVQYTGTSARCIGW